MPQYNFKSLTRLNLTAAGTPQVVSGSSIKAAKVWFQADLGNTTNINIFEAGQAITDGVELIPGQVLEVSASQDGRDIDFIDLTDFEFDGGTTNDDLRVSYLEF